MSSHTRFSRPRLPNTHYSLSLSRGRAIRTVRLRPALLWALVALGPLSLGFGAAGAAYLAFHDAFLHTLVFREARMEAAYEDRLNDAEAHADEIASRRLLERNLTDGKLRDLLSRQARLERDGAVVAALIAETARGARLSQAKDGAPALAAIRALSPEPQAAPAPPGDGAARAYAPTGLTVQPKSVKLGDSLSGLDAPASASNLAAAAANADLDPRARIDLIERSLERVESGQMIALGAIDRSAAEASARDAAVVAETGLDPMRLAPPKEAAPTGGPYVPVDVAPNAPPFDRAAAHVARDVAAADRLSALMPFMPVRKPLFGDAEVTSPFGYRADPFLGRLALHTGVDLLQAYGAEIRATAAGRVIHAGPMGGYGTMVEIDHGNGLTTRYAHMSEVLVEEGETVAEGTVLGRIGTTGRSTGPHLHYEVRVDGEPVDPERFLRAGAQLSAAE